MPNEYSNFSSSDQGSSSGGQRSNLGEQNAGMVWDPSAWNEQTQSSGAWVPVGQQTAGNAASAAPQRTFQAGAWGGQGNMLDAQGNPVLGTSGAAQDVGRYRDMGQQPQYQQGPQINQEQSNESRGLSMGALGLLGNAAAGTQPSAAEQLGTKQAQDAQAAQFSMGASVRGGAANRAAAARHAVTNAATIQQRQVQANQATRAGEMATARGQYLDSATGQRQQDIGVATSQAGLDVGQRQQNDQREGFYESLSQDTKNAELSHQLGRSASEANAANAAFNTSMQADRQAQARLDKNIDMGLAGAKGAAAAYQKTSKPNPDDVTGSDERMKRNIKPVSDSKAAKLAGDAKAMQTGADASLDAGASVGGSPVQRARARARKIGSENPYDQYDRSIFATEDSKNTQANTAALHAGIEQQLAKDKPALPDSLKGTPNPYAHQALFGQAPEGYAKARKGLAGSMFGPAPEAQYRDRVWGPGEHDALMGLAPGSDDFEVGNGKVADNFSRQIMTSDDRAKLTDAKREAFLEGANYAVNMTNPVAEDPVPDYVHGKYAGGPAGGRAASTVKQSARGDEEAAVGFSAKRPEPAVAFSAKRPEASPDKHEPLPDPPPPGVSRKDWVYPFDDAAQNIPYEDLDTSAYFDTPKTRDPESFVRVEHSAPKRGLTALAPKARTMMSSDERSKQGLHVEGPMASSNRSMKPHSYEYRPEFAQMNGQHQGEANVGPMAQQMAKDPVAKTAIVKDPGTGMLAIDKAKGLKLALGGLASLQSEVDELKKRGRK